MKRRRTSMKAFATPTFFLIGVLLVLSHAARIKKVIPPNTKSAAQTEDASVKKVSKPPNVIVLLVDDLGYGDLGIQGNESLSTPNIDRIGKEGVRFTLAFSLSDLYLSAPLSWREDMLAMRHG